MRRLAGRLKRLLRRRLRGRERSRGCQKTLDVGLKVEEVRLIRNILSCEMEMTKALNVQIEMNQQ